MGSSGSEMHCPRTIGGTETRIKETSQKWKEKDEKPRVDGGGNLKTFEKLQKPSTGKSRGFGQKFAYRVGCARLGLLGRPDAKEIKKRRGKKKELKLFCHRITKFQGNH